MYSLETKVMNRRKLVSLLGNVVEFVVECFAYSCELRLGRGSLSAIRVGWNALVHWSPEIHGPKRSQDLGAAVLAVTGYDSFRTCHCP